MTDELNFDSAIPKENADGAGEAQAGVVRCSSCQRPLTSEYFTANGAPLCAACRTQFEVATAPVRQPALLAKAALFGFGAAVVGAVIYYAVMRYLNLEIGLVAILTGWMVGKAVIAATKGRGGLVLQLGSAALTYISVAMAYFPFAMQQAFAEGAAADSIALAAVALFALALPVLVVVGSMPSGLISALIIGIGMLQAWQLTAAPKLVFEGPFRVGGSS